MNRLIEWLIGPSCIGLVVSLNKNFSDRYIKLVKTNSEVKKSISLGEDKEIFKIKKDLPEKSLISLYVVILERIKDNERLIKEHSMQINSLQTNYPVKISKFILEQF